MEATGTHPAIIETPLAAHHKSAGANIGTWFGCALPNDFGDWQREYEIAKNTVALIDENYLAYFSFTGPDRHNQPKQHRPSRHQPRQSPRPQAPPRFTVIGPARAA